MCSIERCRIEDFNNTVAILICEDYGGSHCASHPLEHYKSQKIYYYITWVEIDRKCNKLTDSIPGYPKWLAYLYVLTNKHTSTPEETICHFPVARVVWAVYSAESHRNWQRRHESLLPPAINKKYGDRATGNESWLVSWRYHGGVLAVFLSLVGRIYFALATSSCWYCHHDSDVKTECPHTQAWVSHGVLCLWNHILAWNVTSLVLAHIDMSRRAVVISFCLWIFHMYITVDCAPVTLWICYHGGYWGMVHWLCIWNSQAVFFFLITVDMLCYQVIKNCH